MRWLCLAAVALLGCRVSDLVLSPPDGARLQFSVQPSSADAGDIITPPVQVVVLDDAGQTDTTYGDSVAITLGLNPSGATLSGKTVERVNRGVATFASLRVSNPGKGYVLRASAPARPAAMSAAFEVTAEPGVPVATRLAFTVQPVATQAGAAITPAVRVAARDDAGNTITSFAGTIAIGMGTNPAGGALTGTTTATASNGVATFNNLRIDKAGTGYTLSAAAAGLAGATSAAFNVTALPPPPPPTVTAIVVTPASASLQTGGTQQFGATATLSDGSTQTNPTVTWSATGGTINTGGLYTAGSSAGSFRVIAASANGRADTSAVTLTAVPPPPPPPQATRLVFTVQPTAVQTGSAIAPAVQVAARDDAGNTITSYTGTITIAIGSNPAGGTLSGTLSAVASNGVAGFANLRIDRAGNGYTLTAAASGLTGATSAAFNVTAPPPPPPPPPPQATRLAFIVQPSTTEAGSTIAPAVQVAARDDAGATVTGFAGTISIAIGTNAGGGTLSGTTSATAVNGVATFGGLRIDRAGTGYTLTAGSAGLAGATSATFNVTAPPPPPPPPPPPQATGLRFIVQPSNTGVTRPISPAVRVMAVDANGNQVTGFTGAITVDLAPNLLGATAYGTLTVNAVNGIATFSDVKINLVGVDFRLRAMFAGQTPIVTSNAFIVLL